LSQQVLISLVAIGILGIACQWLAWWARLPAILFLLVIGLIAGPLTGYLDPDALLGDLLFPIVSLSVAIILFEGSLTLNLYEIKGLGKVVRNLISIGAMITWAVTAIVTHYITGLPVELSALFGAVMVVTGPTVIMPMLRTVRPDAAISNILKWEGIVIDPLGALLAVLVFNFIISSHSGSAWPTVIYEFGKIVIAGGLAGFTSAHVMGLILRKHLAPDYLHNVLVLILVFTVFTASDLIAHESGLLAVTIMGMTMANMKDTHIEDILDFKESLSILLISGLFIILAARVDFQQFTQIGWSSLVILAVLMLIARPLSVFVSAIGSDLKFNEKLLISWIGPRGIVAAAVASIFALRLETQGYPEAGLMVPLAFLIIIGTVVIQSTSSKFIAKILDVREPPPTGVLIIGAGIVARVIGKAIMEQGFKVVLTDSNWENTRAARMDGLTTYFGNPISDHAERHLDMIGLGKMLALSGRENLDTLANFRFKSDFGTKNVYQLKTTREKNIPEKHRIATRLRGYQLFGEDITHGDLASWIRKGAEIRNTQLGEDFGFEDFQNKYGENAIPLFAIDNNEKLQFFVADGKMKPEPGWVVVSLIKQESLD
jgi:NhaP-type Na+/H+ or K+/H+ antiporter